MNDKAAGCACCYRPCDVPRAGVVICGALELERGTSLRVEANFQTEFTHSLISSARAINVAGNSRPISFAVFALMNSSNLVGCSTGKSDGLAPFRILSINTPARMKMLGMLGP